MDVTKIKNTILVENNMFVLTEKNEVMCEYKLNYWVTLDYIENDIDFSKASENYKNKVRLLFNTAIEYFKFEQIK
jgi:hypothetical protein